MKELGDFTQLRIDGINIAESLERVMNNKDLYIKMLKRFLEEDLLMELTEQINIRDSYNARFKAHALNGSTANLGLYALSQAAYAVEKLLEIGIFPEYDSEEMVNLKERYLLTRNQVELIIQTAENNIK